ncbi:MAG: hypothetical protein ACK4L4_13930 [Gemmobacter sp.]
MRPNFALTLTFETIGLARRTARGWISVGEVATDSPDLSEMLSYLRSKAFGLSPQGVTTKLVLPNSEILFTDVAAEGSEGERHARVRAALEGMTPYAVDELVFDIQGEGPVVRVAIVARETLEQAEAFAMQHRFNPVSFVATPPIGSFAGEAFFGPTGAAASLIAPGEQVERDADPTRPMPPHEVGAVAGDTPNVAKAGGEDEAGKDAATGNTALGGATDMAVPPLDATGPAPQTPDEPEPPASILPLLAEPSSEAAASAPTQTSIPARTGPTPPSTGGAGVPSTAAPNRAADTAIDRREERRRRRRMQAAGGEQQMRAPIHVEAAAGAEPASLASAPPPAPDAPNRTEPDQIAPDGTKPTPAAHDADAGALDISAVLQPGPAAPLTIPPQVEVAPPPAVISESEAETPPRAPPEASAAAVAPDTEIPLVAPSPPAVQSTPEVISPPATVSPPPAVPPKAAPLSATAAGFRGGAHPVLSNAPPAFASRRAGDSRPAAAASALQMPPAAETAPRSTPAAAPKPAPAQVPPLSAMPSGPPAPPPLGPNVEKGAVPRDTAIGPAIGPIVSPPDRKGQPMAASGAASRKSAPIGPRASTMTGARPQPLTGQVTSTSLPGKRVQTRAPMAGSPDTAPAPSSALQKPSALSRRDEAVGGKPRYLGLVLTGALLLVLVLIAAWSSLYLSRSTGDEEPTRIAGQAAPDATTPPMAPAPLNVSAGDAEPSPPVPPAVADVVPPPPEVTAADPDDSETSGIAPLPAEAQPVETAAAPAQEVPIPVSPVAALAGQAAVADAVVAGNGLAEAAQAEQDEIFLSTLDAAPPSFDAIALPPVAALVDGPPAAPMAPPPFGTIYSFDPDGRIAAGPRGVVTPDGVWLIAARPPVIPPRRPDTVAAPPAELPAALTGTVPADQPAVADEPAASAFEPDARATSRRPAPRPETLTLPTPAEAASDTAVQVEDDAALTLSTDPRLASLRPRPRSAAILARAEAVQSASLVQQASAAAVAAPPSAFAEASALAVPISRRPAARPKDFSAAVAAAVAAATRPIPASAATPAAPAAARQSPAPDVEEEDEPELVAARTAPRIPTRADVARQATFSNAINLSKINLIGIYGTASNRHALVRTPNGRYNKVKVGDRVDGGTVAAITSTELRYQKGGRMLSLQMPRG